ncbi:hypothetical protein [Flavobacterium solisilvae]|uniref:Glycosyl transferase n=1 Tax=Flavobacterium solisilvae TaxID=1852019 RepID=A0ABX1QW43_9FLAO|nr:hypothetical protein [Flavobacterium solisilvae]NMH25328.1 hypothetical protein [Flavobacterium solisilvae]
MKKLCFTTFIFGSYQKYIPYYIYSIGRTYPEAYVKVFIDKSLNNKVLKCLDTIKTNGFVNFEIIPVNFQNLDYFNDYKIRGGGTKTLFRWLFDYKYFIDFDYLYYGDVDILILPEKEPLLELHVRKIKDFKVPFSNMVRKNDKGVILNRLSGLHFVETKQYFEKINPIICQILNNQVYRDEIMKDVVRDEQLLYEMNKIAFDFDESLLASFQRPIHGIHLGFLRTIKNIQSIKDHLNYHQISVSQEELIESLKIIYKDPIFQKISKLCFLNEFYILNKYLKINNPISWKVSVLKNSINKIFKRIILKFRKV